MDGKCAQGNELANLVIWLSGRGFLGVLMDNMEIWPLMEMPCTALAADSGKASGLKLTIMTSVTWRAASRHYRNSTIHDQI